MFSWSVRTEEAALLQKLGVAVGSAARKINEQHEDQDSNEKPAQGKETGFKI